MPLSSNLFVTLCQFSLMSSFPTSLDSPSLRRSKGKSVTLADHLGNERLKDKDEPPHLHCQNLKPTTTATTSHFSRLRKQKSCKEFNNSENNTFTGRSSFSENSAVKKASSCNHDIVPRRLSFDGNTFSSYNNNSSMMKKLVAQRASSPTFTGYMSSKSQWALSPGRSGSPPMSVESKDRRPFSFSSFRPQNKKILTMGFNLFTSNNKALTSTSTTSSLAVHHLRMLNNGLLQWRFANCKAHTVNDRMSRQTERNFIHALDGLTKLQSSVSQKKIQLERELLEMKLNSVLHSQMRLLEGWGDMETEHLAALGVMKECLHSIVCKVPLLQGAKADIQSTSIAERHASDLIVSINSVLSTFSPSAYKTVELLSELAKVVVQEKLLLEDINNLFRSICVLELKERSMKCSLIQL